MDDNQKKELLHLLVKQENEKLLNVLADLAESVYKTYQPEANKKNKKKKKNKTLPKR